MKEIITYLNYQQLEFPLTRLDKNKFEYRGKKFTVHYDWNNLFSYKRNVDEFWKEVWYECLKVDKQIKRENQPITNSIPAQQALDEFFKMLDE